MTGQEWQIVRAAVVAWPFTNLPPTMIGEAARIASSTLIAPGGERWPSVALWEHRTGNVFPVARIRDARDWEASGLGESLYRETKDMVQVLNQHGVSLSFLLTGKGELLRVLDSLAQAG